MARTLLAALAILGGCAPSTRQEMPWVTIADGRFTVAPRGFNYDHDVTGRLIEDYWATEWPKVEAAFRDMKAMGATVVRVHLQFGKFMETARVPRKSELEHLSRLLELSERTGIYLDLTGLGCYHRKDVPEWYDRLSEEDRWAAQARFWEAVAGTCARSPAIFCYDLMNEPVVPVGKSPPSDWLGPPFGGKHFVQRISLDDAGRPRHEIARLWIRTLVAAIRKVDKDHLITVGLVDWSLDRKGVLYSGFKPEAIAPEVDFLSIHLYPEAKKVEAAVEKLEAFRAAGKPVVIEETFLLSCGLEEFRDFLERTRGRAAGVIGFYWGQTLEECRKGTGLGDALMVQWLELFRQYAEARE